MIFYLTYGLEDRVGYKTLARRVLVTRGKEVEVEEHTQLTRNAHSALPHWL